MILLFLLNDYHYSTHFPMNSKDPCLIHNLCQNGATCVSRPNLNMHHFTCICRIGFTGQFCQFAHSGSTTDEDTDEKLTSNEEQYAEKVDSALKKSKNRCLDDELNPCFDKV